MIKKITILSFLIIFITLKIHNNKNNHHIFKEFHDEEGIRVNIIYNKNILYKNIVNENNYLNFENQLNDSIKYKYNIKHINYDDNIINITLKKYNGNSIKKILWPKKINKQIIIQKSYKNFLIKNN